MYLNVTEMKNILSTILFMAVSGTAFSQTFSIPNDTVSAYVVTTYNMHNDITNISASDITVTWRVTDHDLPLDWTTSFAICDNNLCYYNVNNSLLGGNSYTTATITPSSTANFYVLPDLTNATTNGTHFVKIVMNQGSTTIPSWYLITRGSTSVTSVAHTNKALITYPNPATDKINLLIDESQSIRKVSVVNIGGQVVSTKDVSGSVTTIDMSGLSSGIYVVKAFGAEGQVIATTNIQKL